MTAAPNRYLEAIAKFDWDAAAECLNENVVRVGPFGDTYEGREKYLGYLAELMPSLAGYHMDIGRQVQSSDGRTVVVELSEDVTIDSKVVHTPECLVFDLDAGGLIERIVIYIQK